MSAHSSYMKVFKGFGILVDSYVSVIGRGIWTFQDVSLDLTLSPGQRGFSSLRFVHQLCGALA